MKKKQNHIIDIQKAGKFYIIDYADGTRIIGNKKSFETVAANRKKKK